MNQSNHYEPDFATAPGDTLSDKLEEMGMTQTDLAQRLGLTPKHVNGIISGKEPITQETAIGLERVLGIPLRFWINREMQYRERLARLRDKLELSKQTDVLDEIPVKELIKRGYLQQNNDKAEMLKGILAFYGVKGVAELRTQWNEHKAAARKSSFFEERPGHTAAWLRIGEIEAQNRQCADFDKDKFHEAIKKIRSLTTKEPAEFLPEMRQLCENAGVVLALVPEIRGVGWFGASWWQSPTKAVVELNLRGKKEDQFWFSFFHEAGHILQSQKRTIFIDDKSDDDDFEKRANRFAEETLIPRDHQWRLALLKSHADIVSFSKEIGISPGIVVGQYQHTTEHYTWFNKLKRTFVWSK